MDDDGTNIVCISSQNENYIYYPIFTSNGQSIIYFAEDRNIYTVDIRGRNKKMIYEGFSGWPEYVSTERDLVSFSNGDYSNSLLFIINLEGDLLYTINPPGRAVISVIHPSEDKLLYLAYTSSKETIYTMNFDSGDLREVYRGDSWYPKYSHSGELIGFKARPYRSWDEDIFVSDLYGNDTLNLTKSDHQELDFLFTHDDSKIITNFNENGYYGISVAEIDGSNYNELLLPPEYNIPTFDIAPNDSKIIFQSYESTPIEDGIFIMNLDGSGIEQLTDFGSRPKYQPN